ncbi:MAG: mini-circle protein [Frankiales bacterium]|nr:mini-circle protein [Frankiales bacterium]
MTLGGLLKHMALVEDAHFARLLLAEPPGEPWNEVDFDADPDWEWRTAKDDSPEQLTRLWQEKVELSRRRVADAVAVAGMETEGRYVTRSGQHPLLRRIVVDMISEYARHLGHADLIRESIDGLVGEEPESDQR